MVQSSHIVRGNTISDNGLCGIVGWNSPGVRIYNNVIERNNRLHFSKANSSWEEWAGIKLHGTNAVISGNTIRDNEAHGVWIDNDYNGARITGNTILGNLGSGVFLELGAGSVIVDHNIIAKTRPGGDFFGGNGVYFHDASGVRVVHNLLMNNHGFGVKMRAITSRKIWGAPVCASNEVVANNIFVENGEGAIDFPFPNPRGEGSWSDRNLYLWSKARIQTGHSFYLNKYQGKFSWGDVHFRLVSVATGNGAGAPGALDAWSKSPCLELPQWRALLGWDQHSVVAERGQDMLDSSALQLTIDLPEEAFKIGCQPIAEVRRDFAGEEIKFPGALPGPFQSLVVGTNTLSIDPPGLPTPPERRRRGGEEAPDAPQLLEKFRAEIDAISTAGHDMVATETFTHAAAPWFHSLQKRKDPSLAEPFDSFGQWTSTTLYARSEGGVCSSPAKSALYRVGETGRYQVVIDGSLKKRTAASAGFARVQIYQLDAFRSSGFLLDSVDLNTEGGYRAGALSDRFEWSVPVSAPAYSYIGLRFQIVAPGPAPAGEGWLEVGKFSVFSVK